jgi:hypothetical protein
MVELVSDCRELVAEHLKTAVLPCPGKEEILLVEVGGPDFIPTQDEMEEISDLFLAAVNEAGSDCPAVVVLNRTVDVEARAMKLQEVLDLVAELNEKGVVEIA